MASASRRLSRLCAHVGSDVGSSQLIAAVATQAEEEGPLVRVEHGLGGVSKVVLCRPKKLNSLSLPMIRELKARYGELERYDAHCLILCGEGRALCAGGDVAEVREGILTGNRIPADFFYEEYELDYEIATLWERLRIVQIALWDGIVMGGGVGLSVHSPIRIATERTQVAMPETLIGLFPDVGMTWALSRLPAGIHVGLYLGLTGVRLGPADCMAAGLATHYCPSARLPEVEAALRRLGLHRAKGDLEAVGAAIREAAGGAAPDKSKAVLEPNMAAIERCFGAGARSAEDIVARLQKEDCAWSRETLANLQQRSPTSVKVTLEAVKRHATLPFKDAFVNEYRISQWCMRPQPESDFCEGIRAVLVDKDHKPKWTPARFEDVSQAKVDGFFAPLLGGHPRGELDLEAIESARKLSSLKRAGKA